MRRPAKCHGPRDGQHAAGCRLGRPACRWRRRDKGICLCVAYHFPHRDGSGRCGDPVACDAWANGPSSDKPRSFVDAAYDIADDIGNVFADMLGVDCVAGAE